MRMFTAAALLSLSSCVDAIDQSAKECERIMLPPILEKTASLPDDGVLRAKNVEIEHWLEGGENRLKALQAKIRANWKKPAVGPVDEIHFALFLTEDAVGFAQRAKSRTRELCALAQANRVIYEHWSYGALGMADHFSQATSNMPVQEVPSE